MELLIRGEICSARLALARRDLETAQQALQQLETLFEQEGFAYLAPWVSMLRVQTEPELVTRSVRFVRRPALAGV